MADSSEFIEPPRGFEPSSALVALNHQSGSVAECYRALRTHIMAQHVQEGRRALAVCAASSGVGCTGVTANLAIALSQIGVKTLLIDVNLRDPGIEQMFGPTHRVSGLQQCLEADDPDFANYIEHDVFPNLSIMFAGGVPDNPQELLAADRFSDLMDFCLRQYDMTVVDTPPANSCSDVHRVSTVLGYSMIVTRRNRSLVSDVRTLMAELESDGARVVGTVMTEV